MPTLIIARHAKTEAPGSGKSDMDRALELIGRKASAKLGEAVASAGLAPTLALVSPALRAQQTWKLMAAALAPCETRTVDDIYETDIEGLIDVIREVGEADTVILVGHEPTSSGAAAQLAGPGSERTALQRVAQGLPTGTAAVIEFDIPWGEIEHRTGRMVAVLSGRDVGE